MLINKTFFTGDVFIANLNESCDNLNFFEWIERWEQQCLRNTLGDCIYNQLIEELEWDDTDYVYKLKDTSDAKWSRLIYGHNYTNEDIQTSNISYTNCGCGCNGQNCDTYHWDGIIKTINRRIAPTDINGQTANGIIVKSSYIAYYIYWLWSLNSDSFTSSTGEQTANVKNANRISNVHKRVEAHNKFVSWVVDCGSHGKVGLYKFIQDFSDDFPEWQGVCLEYEPIW